MERTTVQLGFRDMQTITTRAAPRAQQQELAVLINSAMQQLPEPERLTLIMADMHGLSYDEIARCTRVPVATVRTRLSGARWHLRDYMLKHQDLLAAPYRYTPRPSDKAGRALR